MRRCVIEDHSIATGVSRHGTGAFGPARPLGSEATDGQKVANWSYWAIGSTCRAAWSGGPGSRGQTARRVSAEIGRWRGRRCNTPSHRFGSGAWRIAGSAGSGCLRCAQCPNVHMLVPATDEEFAIARVQGAVVQLKRSDFMNVDAGSASSPAVAIWRLLSPGLGDRHDDGPNIHTSLPG